MNCPHCGKAVRIIQDDLFNDKLVKVEAGKLYLPDGTKARQLGGDCVACGGEVKRNRNWEFSEALRIHRVPALDIDFVTTNGANTIRLVLECTRPEEKVFSPEAYFAMIDARRRDASHGNHNDQITKVIADLLGCTAILVVFEPDIHTNAESPVWYRHIERDDWTKEPLPAREFFNKLRSHAVHNNH